MRLLHLVTRCSAVVAARRRHKPDADRPEPEKAVLPENHHAWAVSRSKDVIRGLEEAGYHLVGDLDELLPVPPGEVHVHV